MNEQAKRLLVRASILEERCMGAEKQAPPSDQACALKGCLPKGKPLRDSSS